MKYHKIKNVPLSVCTAEQKIAYNLAFSWHEITKKNYNKMPCAFQKNEVIYHFIRTMIECYKSAYDYKPGKYDIDAIFCALNAGFEKYINSDYSILNSYEEIGKMFPAYYL